MRCKHALFIVAFVFSESLALDNAQTCSWRPNGNNYMKHLTAIANKKPDTEQFWKDMSYNTYAQHRDEVSKDWDKFILDESRRPHTIKNAQQLYLKKLSDEDGKSKYYNFWQYLDDIMCVNVIGTYEYPNGFMQDERRANQIIRVNISSHRKYKYHTSKARTERNLNRLYKTIKPTVVLVYNKCATIVGVLMTFFGFGVDWKHFANKYYMEYDPPVADGFADFGS